MSVCPRRKVLITGAAGGMGRACARLFGATQDLVLTDVTAASLDAFAEELRRDGYTVATFAGDLSGEALQADLVAAIGDGAPFTLIHTAGLSPSLADWQTIMQINLVATELLLRAIEPKLVPGSAAVLIASTAGHMMPPLPDIEAVLADPLQPGFIDKVGGIIQAMGGDASQGGAGGISYSLSKKAVIQICERRAAAWGKLGARITSISPGMILTPMGRSEMESSAGARQVLGSTPAGRVGTPMDIALTAQFLTSDAGGFISGSDIKVDGGCIAAMKPG
jgi:NAD(P)-dependent dehydrogenase (short-subunit alcohol dehydrogenase family)